MIPATKNPDKVRAGKLGARAKWGPDYVRRVVRLDELTEPQRRVVLSLITAAKTAPDKP